MIRKILLSHTALLRAIGEQLTALTKAVTPPPKKGPSLDEMLMAVVTLLREQGMVLTRVDDRTMALGVDLPPLIARAIFAASKSFRCFIGNPPLIRNKPDTTHSDITPEYLPIRPRHC